MFYADFVLSKKGPLSKVWLAAHWEKKLTKVQIFETDVDEAVNEIMQPSQKLALRTTGHLLVGICRVYSRKTKYLLADTNEAFLKIKLAFRNGALHAPNPDPKKTFTLQDIYGECGDNILPEFDDEELNHAPICQSRIDDITLKEDIPHKFEFNLGGGNLEDDDFGEIAAGVGPEDYQRLLDDCNRIDFDSNGLFGREREPTPFLNDVHAPGNAIFGEEYCGGLDDIADDDDHDHQSSSGIDHVNGPMDDMSMDYETENHNIGNLTPLRSDTPLRGETPLRSETPATVRAPSPTPSIAPSVNAMEQDTVESFYERQAQKRQAQAQQTLKKRRLDEVKMITGDEMKANMADFSDTLTRLDMAPPTSQLMHLKKGSMIEYLHHHPAMIGFAKAKLFVRSYQELLTIEKNEDSPYTDEWVKRKLDLHDIGEAEMQLQQQEMDLHIQDDPAYMDDFEGVAPIDLDHLDMLDNPQDLDDYGQEDDFPQPNPLSPYNPIPEDEDLSPSEKRRKKEEEKEEQETDEDNRWSKRTYALLQTISTKLNNSDNGSIEIDELMKKNTSRKIAASKFYSLLCLKKNQCVEVTQKEPYGEIKIQAGPNINVNMI